MFDFDDKIGISTTKNSICLMLGNLSATCTKSDIKKSKLSLHVDNDDDDDSLQKDSFIWGITPLLLRLSFMIFLITRIILIFWPIKILYSIPSLLFVGILVLELSTILTKKQKESRQKLTAANAVLNAFKEKGALPTVEEAKEASKIYIYNDFFIMTSLISMQIVGLIIYTLLVPTGFFFILLELGLIFLYAIFFDVFPFTMVSIAIGFLLIEEPKDIDFIIALTALDALLKCEAQLLLKLIEDDEDDKKENF